MARVSKKQPDRSEVGATDSAVVHIRMSTRPEDRPRTRGFHGDSLREREIRDAVRSVIANRKIVRRDKNAVVIAIAASDLEMGKAVRIKGLVETPSATRRKPRQPKVGD